MGKVKNNVLVQALSGKIDGILLKQYSYGTVISKMPDRSKVKLTKHQKVLNGHFQEAVAFAQSIIEDPQKKMSFSKAAKKRGLSVYHYVLSEYMKGNLP